mgnify:CR=1 FL=1
MVQQAGMQGQAYGAQGQMEQAPQQGQPGAEQTGDGTRLTLETWIDDQDGSRTAIGWASAIVAGEAGSPS